MGSINKYLEKPIPNGDKPRRKTRRHANHLECVTIEIIMPNKNIAKMKIKSTKIATNDKLFVNKKRIAKRYGYKGKYPPTNG